MWRRCPAAPRGRAREGGGRGAWARGGARPRSRSPGGGSAGPGSRRWPRPALPADAGPGVPGGSPRWEPGLTPTLTWPRPRRGSLTQATFYFLLLATGCSGVLLVRMRRRLRGADRGWLAREGEWEEEGEDGDGEHGAVVEPEWDAAEKGAFRETAEAFLGAEVPLVLTARRLRSHQAFTCAGSRVVKMHAYHDLKSLGVLHGVLPDEDPLLPAGGKKRRKCAVVGNSGSVLEHQFGAEIDQHDTVFRFNAGVTEDYEQFVGETTSFRFFNRPERAGKYLKADAPSLTILRDTYDVKSWAKTLERVPSTKHYMLDPAFLCHAWDWVENKGQKPSSGLLGVVLALHACKTVDLYGFDATNYFQKNSRPHYYDWERPQKGREKVHPFAMEHEVFQRLHSLGFIRIH